MNARMDIICREQCAVLAGSTVWTSDSSHACPSPDTIAMLMMAPTFVRLGAMATACCFKDILLWRGGCEGCQSKEVKLHVKEAFHLRV